MTRPVVLFDVMDTLVRDPFHEELPRAFGYDKEGFLKNKRADLWPKFERGEITEEAFVSRCLVNGQAPSVETVRSHLREGYRWIDGVVPLLAKLKSAGINIYAFSNYPVWYRLIEETLSLSDYLEWRFVSWETGFRKPDQQAYTHALSTLDRRPRTCVFVDNSSDNCRMAKLLGMKTHRFVGAGRLERFLSTAGLSAGDR